ncbi:uncharacterized protein LOC106866368 [Brachypodium distachyon]|uniref:BED-type domain-containing protein n=1 Tax=Brachypodium distachyon TaxID=15368 RepID=A0A0Q3F8C1_BRADI|nr:uncharacterized protein LOC106866368 [Brachypodium distachyon]KQJ95646.1 hypothetical protein BRADI_3g18330v3 [Brachypodium distachyon]PNT66904.1 hypothetical protein BRADI_3g18330v3 [Brachypodium distachyon]|eukprot:XP_024316905.1 uncharacterized protein LOC106866368 [Brachypodium distachyon]
MANQVVSDEARGGGGGGASTVWKHFHRNVVVSGAGAGSGCTATCRCGTTATCRRCGTMLKACPRKHGTSHLHRHARSAACALRAQAQAQRVLIAPEPAADDALTWLEDHVVDGDVDVDGHLNIRSGAQEMQEAGCTKPCSPPNYVPLPQVSNSSSKRFLKKKRNRHSYDRGSAREVHEGRRPASSAPEPQLCRRQEEKAASDKYDDDEENFKDLPSILSSGWEIDSVSDSGASNTPQEQAGPAPCPPSPQPPAAAAATSISLPIGN